MKFTPAQLSLGAAYRIVPEWLLSLDLTWSRSSKYEIPFGDVSLDLTSLLPDYALLPPKQPQAKLRDVFIPRIAAEWSGVDNLLLRAGYAFEPTFVESIDQVILDSDKHTFAAGGSYRIDPFLLDEGTVRWTVSVSSQLLWHTRRHIGALAYSGFIAALTFGTEVHY